MKKSGHKRLLSIDLFKDKRFLQRHVGDISQIAGLKRYALSEGKAKGIDAVDIKTGSGLNFTVLPGRGMDIAWAEFQGIPFGYISKTGIVSPNYYESHDLEWLRTFFAGLLTTCGLSNVGPGSVEPHPVFGEQRFGLHGRISNMAADFVAAQQGWQDEVFTMSVSGSMRESVLHGENMVLRRKISTTLGAKSFHIYDEIENEGSYEQPLMILYHFNIGYPVLSPNSRFISPSREIIPANEYSKSKRDVYDKWSEPIKGEPEHLFFHDFKSDQSGLTCCAIINPDINFGIFIRYSKNQLPRFTQWKMIGEAEYVLGMEPGNCNPIGREKIKNNGEVEWLKPGEKKNIELEIGVLSTQDEINAFTKIVESLQ